MFSIILQLFVLFGVCFFFYKLVQFSLVHIKKVKEENKDLEFTKEEVIDMLLGYSKMSEVAKQDLIQQLRQTQEDNK